MSNKINSLSAIISELQKYPKGADESTRDIIVIEKKTGDIIDKPPILNIKPLRFFEIFANEVVFEIKGPSVPVNYLNANNPFVVDITYDARIYKKKGYKLALLANKSDSLENTINKIIYSAVTNYVFSVGNQEFVNNFNKHQQKLSTKIKEVGIEIGMEVTPYFHYKNSVNAKSFINISHSVRTRTKDAQEVEIKHDLGMTLYDQIKFSLAGINDIKQWAISKLEQYTHNSIIEMNYADVLIDMDESIIRGPMQKDMSTIGYDLKQLITTPGVDIEGFFFETQSDTNGVTEYVTSDSQLKINLNILVSGKLDLNSKKTKNYIKPNVNIIDALKRKVIELAKLRMHLTSPDECYMRYNEFEEGLIRYVVRGLKESWSFKENELFVAIKFLETNLSKRFFKLQERPQEVKILADFGEKSFTLWFRVINVAEKGWYRFRNNNYNNTQEELDAIALVIKTQMENFLYRFSENVDGITIRKEFDKVCKVIRREFGLTIDIHNFKHEQSYEERLYSETKKIEYEEKQNMNEMVLKAETTDLKILIEKKQKAIEAEESDEVIKKIDEAIIAIKDKNTVDKSHLIESKSETEQLLSQKEGSARKKGKKVLKKNKSK